MTDKDVKIEDIKLLIEKDKHIIDIFYPNGKEGLSDNHKATYNKLIKNIKNYEKELKSLEEE